MEFYVTTQGLENYGAHQGSGKFSDGKSYWKFKSSTDYIVSGLEYRQDAMAFVASLCMSNGIGWKEFPLEAQTMEEWETQWDKDDENDMEYRDFKLETAKRVNPLTVDVKTMVGDF